MVRLQVALSIGEAEALARLAAAELREPREQLRWLVRQELTQLGLLFNEEGVSQPFNVTAPSLKEDDRERKQ